MILCMSIWWNMIFRRLRHSLVKLGQEVQDGFQDGFTSWTENFLGLSNILENLHIFAFYCRLISSVSIDHA